MTDTDPALLTQPTISSATYTGTALTGHWSLSGTAPAGTTVTLYDGTTALAPTATATAGTWTIATTENESAIRDYTVIATSAGATSLPSAPYYEGTPGNDVFDFASEAAVSAAALINGNGGASDTLQLTAASTLTDADFAYIKSVEIFWLDRRQQRHFGTERVLGRHQECDPRNREYHHRGQQFRDADDQRRGAGRRQYVDPGWVDGGDRNWPNG